MATPAAVLAVLVTAQGVSETTKKIDKLQGQLEKANARLETLETTNKRTADSTTALDKRFTHLDRSVGDFNRTMMAAGYAAKLLKFPAMIAGAGMATQAVGALSAGVVGLTGSLGPLAGAAGGAAVGFTAMAQGVVVAKLAFKDVGKALGGNKKALEALTPSQKAFVDQLKEAQKSVKSLRETAASNLFPGLNQALKTSLPLLGTLKPVVAGTAKELGNLGVQAANSLKKWGPDLVNVGTRNVGILHNLGGAAITVAGAFKDVLVAAGPLATWMSDQVNRGARYIANQAALGRETGKLAGFFDRSKAAMTQWGHIIANVGAGLFSVFKAGVPLGNELTGSIERLTKRFREWAGSVEGQTKLRTYFANAREPIRQTVGLIGDLGKALGRLSAAPGIEKMIASLRSIVPLLENVISTTTTALGPALMSLATNLAGIFSVFAGTSGPLTLTVKALSSLAGAVNWLLHNVPGLGVIATTLLGLATSYKFLKLAFAPLTGGIAALSAIWGKLTGSAATAAATQTGAATAAKAGAATSTAAVSGLAGAWTRVTGAARLATVAQQTAGRVVSPAGVPGRPGAPGSLANTAPLPGSLAGAPLPAQPIAQAEKTATSSLSRMMGKFASVGSIAMRGAGIAMGGVLVTQMAAQIAGPGSTGKWISAIGNGASIGAAVGSVFGPAGTAGGAVIGGLVGALAKLTAGPDLGAQGAAAGKRWATQFAGQLPGTISPKLMSTLQQATAAGGKQIGQANQASKDLGTMNQWGGLSSEKFKQGWNATFNQIFQAASRMGGAAGQAFGTQMATLTRPTELIVGANMTRILGQVPRQIVAQGPAMTQAWRQSALQQMVAYSNQMEISRQLPKGSTARMIQSIEQQFPALKAFIVANGLQTAQGLANTYRFTQAQNTLRGAVQTFRNTYGDMSMDAKITNGNMLKNVQVAMIDLQGLMRAGPRKGREAATAQYKLLQGQLKDYFNSYLSTTRTKFAGIAAVMGSKSREGRAAGQKAFQGFYNDVFKAMADGVLTTGQGAQLIAQELQSALKTFGSGFHVPTPAILFLTRAGKQGVSTGVSGRHLAARGALMQVGHAGQGGRDTVPMSVGGQNIMVGAGEQVAVFTRHQQKAANAALAPMGGLPGLFSTVNRPNYMAQGGMVPGFSSGGIIGQAAIEDLWKRAGGDPAKALLMSAIAEAESGGDPNNYNPSGATGLWQIMMPSNASYVPGGNARDPMSNAIAAVRILGAQGLSAWEAYTNGSYAKFMHGLVAGGGAGVGAASMWKNLKPPKVTGGGTVSRIVQATMNKMTAAANADGKKHMPAPAAGSGVNTTGITGKGGLGNFGGLQVANWIVPILNWARGHGWTGSITSGFRPGSITSSGHISNHAGTSYPTGAVDVGDKTAISQGAALWNVVKNYPGSPKLYSAAWGPGAWGPYEGYPHDYGHFSATGRAKGGFVDRAMTAARGYAKGGAFRVMASLESDGGQGSFGFSPGGMGYSILGRMGNGSDGDAGAGYAVGPGRWGSPNPMLVRHAGILKTLALQDRGSGSPGLHPYPTVGIYPTAARSLHMSDNGMVDIERADHKAFTTLRGTPIPAFVGKAGKAVSKTAKKVKAKHYPTNAIWGKKRPPLVGWGREASTTPYYTPSLTGKELKNWGATFEGKLGIPAPGVYRGIAPDTVAGAAKIARQIGDLKGGIPQMDAKAALLSTLEGQLTLTDDAGNPIPAAVKQAQAYQQQIIDLRQQIFERYQKAMALYDVLVKANELIVARLRKGLASIKTYRMVKVGKGKKAKMQRRNFKGAELKAAQTRRTNTEKQIKIYQGNRSTALANKETDRWDRNTSWTNLLAEKKTLADLGKSSAAAPPAIDNSDLWRSIALTAQRTSQVAQSQTAALAQSMPWLQGMFTNSTLFNAPSQFVGAFATGGTMSSSGWAVVGEKGPELAHLPSGSRIYSNSESGNMVGGGAPVIAVVVQDGAVDQSRIKVIAGAEAQAVIQRSGRVRPLPGRSGGLIRG